MGPEAKIEKAVCDYAKKKGCYVRKFASPGQRGVPDRLILTPFGVVVFIEFKAPGKQPTALQEREIREINNRKGNAYSCDNIDVGKTIVDSHL